MNLANTWLAAFAFFEAFGIIWFSGYTQGGSNFFKAVEIACALIVAVRPQKLIKKKGDENLLIFFCALGICASLVEIYSDFQWAHGPALGAIMFRSLFIFAFAFVAYVIRSEKRKANTTISNH